MNNTNTPLPYSRGSATGGVGRIFYGAGVPFGPMREWLGVPA